MVVSITYEQESSRLTWYLRSGEKAVMGNSPWCDFVLPSIANEAKVSCTLHLEDILLVEVESDTDLPTLSNKTNTIAIQTSDSFNLRNYPIAVTFLAPRVMRSKSMRKCIRSLIVTSSDTGCDDDSNLWFDYVLFQNKS